ncbi:MAG: hypothetical protein EOP88_09435 [Verrucomicrobiaceae bacterium]|nr:MAG: hypothetical protein EOP88_09435 [Verrucomicrobiaceae bacterium]
MKHPTLRLAALVVFSTAGLVGWKLAAPPSREKKESASEKPGAGKRAERATRHPRSAAADQAGKRMASIRLAGSTDARMRATIDLANSLSPAEFSAWMDGGWFTLRGGPELTLFTKIVMERWKLEDEEGLMVWMIKNGNGQSEMIAELAKKNPERLIGFFRENPSGSREMVVLWEMVKDHPDLALARFQEIVAGGRWREVQGYAGQLVRNLAEKDPAKLAAAMEDFPPAVKLQAEIALSGIRMKESFATEIRALWDRPDGWKIFEGQMHSRDGMGDKLLGELANLPPSWRSELASSPYYLVKKENAMQWWDADLAGAGFTPRDVARIRTQALSVIGQENPQEAIRRMDELQMDSDNRRSFISSLFGNIGDQEKAREMVAHLPTEEDRNKANEMLDQRFSPTSPQTKVEDPADWLAKVAETNPARGGMSYQMYSVLEEWDEEKIGALATGFRSMDADKKAVVAQVIVNGIENYGRMTNLLAGDAIRYMMENPPPVDDANKGNDNNLLSKAGYHAVQLSNRDPAAAGEWVATLPAGETRTWTQWNLLNNWRQYDPKAAGQWEKSLSASDRAALQAIAKKRNR